MAEVYDAAMELLETAKGSDDGVIMNVPVFGRLVNISIGNHSFPESHDPRSEARYKSALKELLDAGLVEDRIGKGQVFHLTAAGYNFDGEAQESPGRRIGFRAPHSEDE